MGDFLQHRSDITIFHISNSSNIPYTLGDVISNPVTMQKGTIRSTQTKKKDDFTNAQLSRTYDITLQSITRRIPGEFENRTLDGPKIIWINCWRKSVVLYFAHS